MHILQLKPGASINQDGTPRHQLHCDMLVNLNTFFKHNTVLLCPFWKQQAWVQALMPLKVFEISLQEKDSWPSRILSTDACCPWSCISFFQKLQSGLWNDLLLLFDWKQPVQRQNAEMPLCFLPLPQSPCHLSVRLTEQANKLWGINCQPGEWSRQKQHKTCVMEPWMQSCAVSQVPGLFLALQFDNTRTKFDCHLCSVSVTSLPLSWSSYSGSCKWIWRKQRSVAY